MATIRGKGRNPYVLSKPWLSLIHPSLLLSSTLQVCAVTISVPIRKERLWEVGNCPGSHISTVPQSPCPFNYSALQTPSEVERQKLCPEIGFSVSNILHVATFLLRCHTLGWLQWRPLGLKPMRATVENIIKNRESSNR